MKNRILGDKFSNAESNAQDLLRLFDEQLKNSSYDEREREFRRSQFIWKIQQLCTWTVGDLGNILSRIQSYEVGAPDQPSVPVDNQKGGRRFSEIGRSPVHEGPTIIHLIGFGLAPAKKVCEFVPGERMLWNYGQITELVRFESSTYHFLTVVSRGSDGVEHRHRMKKNRLVAYPKGGQL